MKADTMAQCRAEERENSIHVFGMTKTEIWVMNHMVHIGIGCAMAIILACTEMYINNETNLDPTDLLSRCTLAVIVLVLMIASLRFLVRNVCQRIEIDTASGKVRLSRPFNKGTVDAPIRLVEFRADRHFACLYNGERFTILNVYIKRIEKVLPPGVEIHFSKNFFARLMRALLR